MKKKITKLVLPVAGLGKRLQPLTLETPKNLLLLNGKPLLEYVLEEALETGIKDVILIANPVNKKQFQDYIKKAERKFPFRFHLRFQDTPGGNGHALLAAKDLVECEPFAVRFCDDILLSKKPILRSLIELHDFYGSSSLLLQRIPLEMVSRFGVVGVDKIKTRPAGFSEKIHSLNKVIEKPPLESAPSNLIVLGGYALAPSVFRNIQKVAEAVPSVAADAIPINIGLQIELIIGNKIYGWEFEGERLDCGTLESFRESEKILKQGK